MIGLARFLPADSLLRRGATLFVSNGVGQALAFVASVAIARILGVQSFGFYAAIMAVVFVLGLFVEAGLETTLSREVAANPDRATELLTGSIAIKLFLGGTISLILALPLVAGTLAPDPSVQAAVQLAGPLITLGAINSSYGAVFRALGRTEFVLLINVTGLGIQLAGMLVILFVFRSLTLLFAWLIVVQLFELYLGNVLFKRVRNDASARPGKNFRGYFQMLKRSWPFALAGVLGAFTLRIDLFIIEVARGAAQVGVYSASTRLNDLLALAPNSFYAVLLPAMAAQHVPNAAESSDSVYGPAVRRMALAGALLAIVGLLFADVLVWIFFGPAYSEAATPLRVLLVALVPLLVNRTTTVHLYATHREHRANVALVLNLLQRAILGAILVPLWGAVGASVAGLEAECATLIFYSMTGAMGTRGLRRVMRRVAKKVLAVRFRNFKPGAQPDHSVNVAGLRLKVSESVFDPKLHFTSDYLAQYLDQPGVVSPQTVALDLGTGSGIAAIAALRAGAKSVVATDINPAAVKVTLMNAQSSGVAERLTVLQGNMFEPVVNRRFDLLISNPPYLRGSAGNIAERAYMGGLDLEWFDRFASEAPHHLVPEGKVVMVLGDVAETEQILHKFRIRGWEARVAAHRETIVEGLYIYELRPAT